MKKTEVNKWGEKKITLKSQKYNEQAPFQV